MCGIFGIVSREEKTLGPIMIGAGQRLSYRGYDSVGCATLQADGSIDLRKDVGKMDDVAESLQFAEMRGQRGIVQLRWATFGAPSQSNSQPHIDSDGDLVGAHNGNVVNHHELRQQFIAEGMTVRSNNDGETCVHAVERYVDRGFEMTEAIRRAYGDLEGDYSFVIGRSGEDALYAFKKGSGMVVGITDDATLVSSDLPSILPLTREIVRIRDGEIVILRADSVELIRVEDGSPIEREPETVAESMDAVAKSGYLHYMLKEIHEQPKVVAELLHLLEASEHVEPMVQRMAEARHLYLIGCGTSYHACILGAVYLSRLAGRVAIPILAPQFTPQYGDALGPDDVGVFVSQSGETKDVLNAMATAQRKGMHILGLVNVIGSTLMLESERCIPMVCGYEMSVPATKTFMNQVVAFLYLAKRLGGHDTSELDDLPALLEETLAQVEKQIGTIEASLAKHDDLYCLGYGLTYGIALEGALKLKEVTYAHCEGILSTEFKHGPLSAVREDYPVLFVVGPEDVPLLISGINETTCRGGRAIAFAEDDERLHENVHDLIRLPKAGPVLNPLLATIPLQYLSYRLSLLRGIDPDFPRNLSKTLTVD